jgi:O-antigen/teichoic acid export membrane protein
MPDNTATSPAPVDSRLRRMIRRFAPDALIIVALFLLPLIFFAQQTLGGRTLLPAENLYQYPPYSDYAEVVGAPLVPHNHLLSDLVLQNMQWKSFTRDQLAQGEIPLWNPHQFSGIPFLAAGQHSALYPVSALYYALDLPAAYGWYTVVNLWLAGAFMYMFVRGLGMARSAGALAGVVYQFGGFIIASVVFQMMIGGFVWLPLLLLMAEFILRDKPLFGAKGALVWTVIGAGALGMNVLAGHAEITLYVLLITGYYAGVRWLVQVLRRRGTWAQHIQRAGWLASMILLGMALGALQFIPLFEFAQTNWRAERSSLETVLSYAHPMRDVVQFFVPNFYGSPAIHGYWDVFTGQWVSDLTNASGASINYIDWGIKNYVESALYLGIMPLLLAGYALLDRWFLWRKASSIEARSPEPPYRLIFVILAVLSVTFMFGLPTYALIYPLPGINQLNSPFRWIFGLTVAIAVLSAFGMDALLRRAGGARSGVARRSGQVFTLMGVGVLGALGVSYFTYDALLAERMDSIVIGLVKAIEAFPDGRAFYSFQFVQVGIFGVVLTLAGLLVWWAGNMVSYQRHVKWSFAVLTLVVLDLWIASWGFNPASDPALLDFTPPEIQHLQALQAEEGDFRYTTLDDGRAILNANMTWRYGLDDVRGYDSIIGADYVAYMRDASPQGQLDFNRIAPLFTFDWQQGTLDEGEAGRAFILPDMRRYDLLNVRYIVAPNDVMIQQGDASTWADGGSAWEKVQNFPTLGIWRNDNAVPRLYAITQSDMQEAWLTQNLDDATLDSFFNATSSTPRRDDSVSRPLVETDEPTARPYNNDINIALISDSGREKFIDVSHDEAFALIISETYADGWRAFVRPQGAGEDAEEAYDVQAFMGNSQAVMLEAGAWTVRMVYSPTVFQVGLFGSVIGVAVSALMIGMWLWGVLVGSSKDASTTTARVARNSIAPIILNLFNRGIDFAFLLVMLRILAPEEVGIYYYLVVVFGWFDIFTNFGLDLYLIREVSRNRDEAGRYFYNTTLLRLAMAVIGVGLVALFIIGRQATVNPPLPDYALLTLALLYAGLFPATLSKGMTSLYYAFEQAEKPAAIATITSINKAVFGVLALMLGFGIVGLASVSIINNLITFGVLLWAGRDLIGRIATWRPDWKLLRTMRIEGLPLLLNHFLQTIFFQIDIIILEAMKGAVIVAQYSIAYKWVLAINIIPSFFTQALLPVMSRQAQEDKDALWRTYRFGIKLLLSLALPIAVGFTVLAEPLTYIMGGQQYLPAGAIAIQLMIWSIPIGWMNSLTQYVLVALDMQRMITRAFIAAVAFNIISNLIFIPQFSYQAAAITTIFSELALFIPFAILTARGMGQSIGWMSLLWRPVLATGAMLAVVILGAPLPMLLVLAVASVVYGVVLLALKPFSPEEISMMPQRVVQSRVGRLVLGG